MNNFIFHNPVRIVFGSGSIAELARLVPQEGKTMLIYGGGSIRKNGVYDQVTRALAGRQVVEFSGIEPNPLYETCLQAVSLARRERVDFLLAVGGGSVMDATKFIAAAVPCPADDPWDMVLKKTAVSSALPLGCVVTLPATGSEMNGNAVISRASTRQKIPLKSELLLPRFSILDPETTSTLPARQLANGIVDTFVHVCEQYLTYDVGTPLQDRQAEAILLTLIETGPNLLAGPSRYEARANLMWCATQALNGTLACGTATDWASHAIGHEITALFGLDHARALAIVLPAVLRHQRDRKAAKLSQYAQRVWNLDETDQNRAVDAALERTVSFFRSLGLPTRLRDYDIRLEDCRPIVSRLGERRPLIGEHQDIDAEGVAQILTLAE
jgi:NADP-dependent alcohol dehydrogenase